MTNLLSTVVLDESRATRYHARSATGESITIKRRQATGEGASGDRQKDDEGAREPPFEITNYRRGVQVSDLAGQIAFVSP